MKKLILAAAAIMVSVAAFAQGTVNFNNRITGVVDARVTNPDGTGVGAGYTAQLFGGPEGGALVALTPTTTFRTSTAAAQGYVNAQVVTVPNVAASSKATLVMKVFQDGGGEVGKSAPITIALGGGTLPPANLVGLQGFSIVPEPSTIALAALGGAALLALRRRK